MKPISKKHDLAQRLLDRLEEKKKVSEQEEDLYDQPDNLYKFLEGVGYKYTLDGWEKI